MKVLVTRVSQFRKKVASDKFPVGTECFGFVVESANEDKEEAVLENAIIAEQIQLRAEGTQDPQYNGKPFTSRTLNNLGLKKIGDSKFMTLRGQFINELESDEDFNAIAEQKLAESKLSEKTRQQLEFFKALQAQGIKPTFAV